VHEFLDEIGLVPPGGRNPVVAAYHDACHLCHSQGIVAQPRRLLSKIPDLELRPLPESDMCCGSAGVYNIQQPEMGGRLARRKVQNIISTGASIVLAADAGCILQMRRELERQNLQVKVLHTMELLDLSYRFQQL